MEGGGEGTATAKEKERLGETTGGGGQGATLTALWRAQREEAKKNNEPAGKLKEGDGELASDSSSRVRTENTILLSEISRENRN